jgi:hypothetical protein
LNSFVNNLRDNPMTQFSFKWILSLNCLCQNWGQVHLAMVLLVSGNSKPNDLFRPCVIDQYIATYGKPIKDEPTESGRDLMFIRGRTVVDIHISDYFFSIKYQAQAPGL